MARAAAGDDALGRYRAKRDFSSTPEPAGRRKPTRRHRGIFVVQRHRARRPHYDFRLEVDGVLASWAMPKGPSLDPSVRSLAVHVEDHPFEYRDFEGVIPGGQYGAGDVIVWDRGYWEPDCGSDPASDIANGELHFDLQGEKLNGRFVLVKTNSDGSRQERWLMLHKRDEYAQPGWRPEEPPRSVKSGRTNDEVAGAPGSVWRGDLPADRAEVRVGQADRKISRTESAEDPAWRAPTGAELEELEALGAGGRWQFQGRELHLTNLDKVLFPGRGRSAPVTKRELIRYYAVIAPVILPYLDRRPMNMHRFPNGVDKPGFWHKQVPKYAPEWLTRWKNEEAGPDESQVYAIVDSPASLVWMANYAAVELHAWTSREPDVHQPTWALVDIDPGDRTRFEDVVVLAQLYKAALDHLEITGMPKVTGRRGLHIWIPIEGGYSFDETRTWVKKVSRAVGNTVPDLVSWTWQKTSRKGRARLDYTQNAINKTLVAPYSLRAAAGAPISVPMEWEELDDPHLASDMFSVRDVPKRVEGVGDPFRRIAGLPQHLPEI